MTEVFGMSFAKGGKLDPVERTNLLGGKGAGLARMMVLGLPVPPGFTLTTEACKSFLDSGWKPELEAALSDCLGELERSTGKKIGDPVTPLLVSVRSGAPVSMPGMMDTVLNAGITEEIAEGLGNTTGDARFGWDTLRRFLQSYASVVLGAPSDLVREVSAEHLGEDEGDSLSVDDLRRATGALRVALADAGYSVPSGPFEQVRQAVGAVFSSWTCDRAQTYRRLENIADDLFTAVNVQMMAFGNLGENSGTGVAFSRCPSDGKIGLMGDFLQGAQGEDVVAGTHQTLPISALVELWPDVAAELDRTAQLLEHDLRYLADIEFTVEQGAFWMLQYRKGKHSPRAALRMAIDMAEDPEFPLTQEEALERVEHILQDPPMLPVEHFEASNAHVLATGLAASPGQAIGALCTNVEDAVAAEGKGEAVILVRRETSPADIAGMAASVGILTTRGGHVSHAAVVARGWGLPAVVGADAIEVLDDGIRIGDRHIVNGTEITVDGTDGEVLLGAHQREEIEAPEVAILRAWQRNSHGGTETVQTGSFAEEATTQTVSRALALKGMADASAIANVLGAPEENISTVLAELVEAGLATEMPRGRVRALPELTKQIDALYLDTAGKLKDQIEPEMEAFHAANDAFKLLVTDWQMRMIDGQQMINDHSDAEYDASVTSRIGSEIHTVIVPIIENVAKAAPRLIRYRDRLSEALVKVDAGEKDMVAHPLKDSYHTVWFELHEELIRLTARKREE